MLNDNRTRFQFIADALHGKGPFVDGSGLVKYPRESDDKYQRRKDLAWYVNDLAPASRRFVGYLSKRPPTRDGLDNPLTLGFVDDADWQNTSLDVWLANFAVEAKARGTMLVLVDMPKILPDNAADQVSQRAFPYLVAIAPEQLHDYAIDDRGRFEYVEVNSTAERDGKTVAAIRRWDKSGWSVRVGRDILEAGDHPLRVCPVLPFTEGSSFPCFGEFSQIANLSKRLYNLRSELDEILRAQTFSLLAYNVPEGVSFDAKGVAEAIGTHNMLTYPGAAPNFIAPPDGPARVYLETIGKLEEAVRRVGLVVEQATAAKSGVALAIEFESLNSSLSQFARGLEDFERRIWELVAAWLKVENRVSVSYAKDYAISDLAAEIEVLENYQAVSMPDEVIAEKKRQIIALDFSNLESDELDALLSSVDESSSEVPPPEPDPFTEPPAPEE